MLADDFYRFWRWWMFFIDFSRWLMFFIDFSRWLMFFIDFYVDGCFSLILTLVDVFHWFWLFLYLLSRFGFRIDEQNGEKEKNWTSQSNNNNQPTLHVTSPTRTIFQRVQRWRNRDLLHHIFLLLSHITVRTNHGFNHRITLKPPHHTRNILTISNHHKWWVVFQGRPLTPTILQLPTHRHECPPRTSHRMPPIPPVNHRLQTWRVLVDSWYTHSCWTVSWWLTMLIVVRLGYICLLGFFWNESFWGFKWR